MTSFDAPRATPSDAPRGGECDVVVVGGGVAGLVAALDCARAGLQVRLLEALDAVGGCVGRVAVAGVPVALDSGAESFATRGGAVAALVEELGLGDRVVDPHPAGSWLVTAGRGGALAAAPTPKTGVLGIPAHPLAADVRRIVGLPGALRAALDRILPLGRRWRRDPIMLGPLVRARMGARVLDRLVTPISAGVYSADPEVLEVESVAPGLVAAVREHGSLARGVEQQLAARAAARAGGAVRGLDGGIHTLVDALVDACRAAGVVIETGSRVTALAPTPSGGHLLRVDESGRNATAETEAGDRAREAGTREAGTREVEARAVVLAAPAAASLPLLAELAGALGSGDIGDGAQGDAGAVDPAAAGATAAATAGAPGAALARATGETWPAPASIELVTLVLDAPELDARPRGSGLLVARDAPGVAAKALTHASAKWGWLADALPDGRHVVRLSYGRAGQPNPLEGRSDAEVDAIALRDAAAVLGVPLDRARLVGSARVRWADALSHAAAGQADRVARLRAAVAAVPNVAVAGAWVAGTGLASVVPDARAAALGVIRSLA